MGGKVVKEYKKAIIEMLEKIDTEKALKKIYSLVLYIYINEN